MAGCSFSVNESERLVNRLKNTNYEKFSSLVQMHLSFRLDLSGSSLEEFICPLDVDETTESSVAKFFSFGKRRCYREKESKEPGIIFGQPLCQEAIEAMYPLIEFLKKDQCLEEEGLFRKSGQATRQRSLQDSLDKNHRVLEQIEDDLHSGVYTAHDCASIIKMYLRELPEPLLTNRHYVAYCQIPNMPCHKKQLQTMQLLVQLLPQQNFIFLQLLLELLNMVSLIPENKMTADTLATLIAPHVLVPRTTTAYDLQAESCNVTQVMSLMIQYHKQLFLYPDALIRDIRLYWDEMEGVISDLNKTVPYGYYSDDELDTCSCPKFRKRADPTDDAINTTVYFADRIVSSNIDMDYTNKQIAELYAYVGLMPDSPKKRKIVKQFNKFANTDGTPLLPSKHHKRTVSSLGDSLKKVIGTKAPKRKNSYDLPQQEFEHSNNSLQGCNNESYIETTPRRGSVSTFRRHIEGNRPINCRQLSVGSGSQSSLSSTESCDTCSENSNHSISSRISFKSSLTPSQCSDSSTVINNVNSSNPVNFNIKKSISVSKNETRCRGSSQIANILKHGLIPEHICIDNMEVEKENSVLNIVSPPSSYSTPAFCKSSLTRNSLKDCTCLCNLSSSSNDTIVQKTSLKSISPLISAKNTSPKCIRA